MKNSKSGLILIIGMLFILGGCAALSKEGGAWKKALEENTIESYTVFMQQYPEDRSRIWCRSDKPSAVAYFQSFLDWNWYFWRECFGVANWNRSVLVHQEFKRARDRNSVEELEKLMEKYPWYWGGAELIYELKHLSEKKEWEETSE